MCASRRASHLKRWINRNLFCSGSSSVRFDSQSWTEEMSKPNPPAWPVGKVERTPDCLRGSSVEWVFFGKNLVLNFGQLLLPTHIVLIMHFPTVQWQKCCASHSLQFRIHFCYFICGLVCAARVELLVRVGWWLFAGLRRFQRWLTTISLMFLCWVNFMPKSHCMMSWFMGHYLWVLFSVCRCVRFELWSAQIFVWVPESVSTRIYVCLGVTLQQAQPSGSS